MSLADLVDRGVDAPTFRRALAAAKGRLRMATRTEDDYQVREHIAHDWREALFHALLLANRQALVGAMLAVDSTQPFIVATDRVKLFLTAAGDRIDRQTRHAVLGTLDQRDEGFARPYDRLPTSPNQYGSVPQKPDVQYGTTPDAIRARSAFVAALREGARTSHKHRRRAGAAHLERILATSARRK